ncbi:MAG: pyridoxal-phosphate dependent enzyme [Saprospiraceae bacterium]|nr:pyridoxal-phosphate dependent enzyme [Saprospiraceae bacterium]
MTPRLHSEPTPEQIEAIHRSIASLIHRTPVLRSSSVNTMLHCDIFFKCENFQRVGAFKMRGACSAVSALNPSERDKGIATHSSGNHAQAAALAARLFGITAHIVMPENAPGIKRAAVEGYGATIYTSGSRMEERESMITEVLEKTGSTFVHPYNNYNIIAGQATAAKELLEDQPDLDIIMAPVGGGGLLSGTALISRYNNPNRKVYGAEPALVDDARRSFRSGKIESNERIDTIADGLRTTLGDKTLAIIRQNVDDILTVSESTIIEAMRLIWERMKIVVEPSGAVPLAAIMEHQSVFRGKTVGLIISGGNVDLGNLPF